MEWLKLEENEKIFNNTPLKNLWVRFDNGDELPYLDEWPFAEVTHFAIQSEII